MSNGKVKDFVVINLGEYFKPYLREKLYSRLNEKQNLRKWARLLYIFLTAPDEVEKYTKMMQPSSSDKCVDSYKIEILDLSLTQNCN